MKIGRRWPEVIDSPSFWRAEMPKCQVIFDPALSLKAEGTMGGHMWLFAVCGVAVGIGAVF